MLIRGGELVMDRDAYWRVRRFIMLQIAVFALIPLAATLIARDIGM